MTPFKTILITAALIALPSAAMAQIPGGLTDKVKDKAVDTVIDNATPDDALTAGSVIFKGGSKEDAAVAIVKNRAEKKVDGIVSDQVGGIAGNGVVNDAIKGNVPSSATVYDEAKSSATTYKDKDKAAGSATIYKDKGSATTYPSQGSPASTTTVPSAPTATTGVPVNCPAGTTAQPNGTCMITGNWGG